MEDTFCWILNLYFLLGLSSIMDAHWHHRSGSQMHTEHQHRLLLTRKGRMEHNQSKYAPPTHRQHEEGAHSIPGVWEHVQCIELWLARVHFLWRPESFALRPCFLPLGLQFFERIRPCPLRRGCILLLPFCSFLY